MKRIALLLFAVALVAGLVATRAQTSPRDVKPAPQTAKEVRGASPYTDVKNEPAPKLIVDDPLPEGLAQGIVWIQWRVENLQVVPIFGKAAANVSHEPGICTCTWTTWAGGGRTRVISIRST